MRSWTNTRFILLLQVWRRLSLERLVKLAESEWHIPNLSRWIIIAELDHNFAMTSCTVRQDRRLLLDLAQVSAFAATAVIIYRPAIANVAAGDDKANQAGFKCTTVAGSLLFISPHASPLLSLHGGKMLARERNKRTNRIKRSFWRQQRLVYR